MFSIDTFTVIFHWININSFGKNWTFLAQNKYKIFNIDVVYLHIYLK